jgi:hypothetical protein
MQVSTLRPGLFVAMKTSTMGNVKYERRDIVRQHVTKKGTQEAKWETEKTVSDPQEHKAAQEAMTAATLPIRKMCYWTALGWMCLESQRPELDAAIAESRAIVDAFNDKAQLTKIAVNTIVLHIASDDAEAVKSINKEVAELLDRMESGVKNLDVKAIREAAKKAVQIGNMLTDDASDRVQVAIEAARKAARQMTKASEQASMEIDQAAVRRIATARTSFLDLDEAKEVAKPTAKIRAIDLAPEDKPTKKAKRANAPQLDI